MYKPGIRKPRELYSGHRRSRMAAHNMAETFQLEIVTPDRQLVNLRAQEVQVPGIGGYLGVLPGHAPLISELGIGEITYRTGANTEHLAVASGFVEVLPDRVTILAETAER